MLRRSLGTISVNYPRILRYYARSRGRGAGVIIRGATLCRISAQPRKNIASLDTLDVGCHHYTLSRGSLYEVVFSDIIIIITIMITIICLFAAVLVPPMEGTTDSVHFG